MCEEYNLDDIQDTIPEISEDETQNVENGKEDDVTPDNIKLSDGDVMRDTEKQSAQKSVSEKSGVNEPFISVQYNHKTRSFSKEEAVNFIQKGMHTESLRSKLEYLASSQGIDVNSLVEKMVSAPENAYRKHLEELYGKGNQDVEIGMAIYREKQSKEYKKMMAERENDFNKEELKNINMRLAKEYLDLKSEMPDAPEYSDLPDSVIIEAAEGKRDLYSAYLRYLHKEKIKIDAAKNTQLAAATASSGAMGKNNGDGINQAEKNFLSGLWGR